MIAGAEVGTSGDEPAWWHVRVVAGPRAPGELLVSADARRAAGLSSGEPDDDIRFRWLVADALNAMLGDLGEADRVAALRSTTATLRLGRLSHRAGA